ncbi:MAG: PHP domain-containing protein [Clostridia bacterium]|nr:PHP domain-containing protein [Clostridia bacterium]
MINRDYHTHTFYSHGKGTPEEIVLAAISMGLETVAISEHGPGHVFYGVRDEKLRALREEVDRLARRYAYKIQVLMGIECNLTGFGKCDLPEDAADMFDVRLLAFHKGAPAADFFGVRRNMESLHMWPSEPERTALALLEAGERYKIDIFAHPGLYVKSDIPTLARGAKELGIKLEINGARTTMSKEQLRQAVNEGADLIIGSDAHSPDRVGDDSLAYAAAEEAGVLSAVVNIK